MEHESDGHHRIEVAHDAPKKEEEEAVKEQKSWALLGTSSDKQRKHVRTMSNDIYDAGSFGQVNGYAERRRRTRSASISGNLFELDLGEDELETQDTGAQEKLEESLLQDHPPGNVVTLGLPMTMFVGGFGLHMEKADTNRDQTPMTRKLSRHLSDLLELDASLSNLRVPGIYNVGNTCFISALLQALSSCHNVTNYIMNSIDPGDNGNFVNELSEVICKLQPNTKRIGTISLKLLHRKILGLTKNFHAINEQQDTDELLYYLMEAVDKQSLKNTKNALRKDIITCILDNMNTRIGSAVSRPINPLQGTIMSQMVCCTCGSISPLNGTCFRVLPLSLVNTRGLLITSLKDALANFIQQECVEDVKCFGFCNQQRRKMYRRCTLGKLPKTLCIHLNRRHFNIQTGHMIKLTHHVSFHLEMDFSPYQFHCNGLDLLQNLKPLEIKHTSQPTDQAPPRAVYCLKSVVVHHGGADFGHFTASRFLDANTCVLADDQHVSSLTLPQLLHSQAYMLFYEQSEP